MHNVTTAGGPLSLELMNEMKRPGIIGVMLRGVLLGTLLEYRVAVVDLQPGVTGPRCTRLGAAVQGQNLGNWHGPR